MPLVLHIYDTPLIPTTIQSPLSQEAKAIDFYLSAKSRALEILEAYTESGATEEDMDDIVYGAFLQLNTALSFISELFPSLRSPHSLFLDREAHMLDMMFSTKEHGEDGTIYVYTPITKETGYPLVMSDN